MRNEKLTSNMTTMEIFTIMGEYNPGAMNIIMQMMNDPHGLLDICLCDSLDIRGLRLYTLHNDICEANNDKFKRTLMMLRCGIYSEEEILANLNSTRPIPFIDDNIVIDGVPPYGEKFGPTNEKWKEFCNKNREAFIQKLNASLEQEQSGPKIV